MQFFSLSVVGTDTQLNFLFSREIRKKNYSELFVFSLTALRDDAETEWANVSLEKRSMFQCIQQ